MRCDSCDFEFDDIRELIAHKRTHCQVPLECTYCEKLFATVPSLVAHLKVKHVFDPVPCPECGKTMRNKLQLSHHLNQYKDKNGNPMCKTSSGRKECPSCGVFFKVGAHFDKHSKVCLQKQSQVKKDRAVCEFCGKDFNTQAAVTSHVKVHHPDDLPGYKQRQQEKRTCSDCGKICKNPSGFIRHRLYCKPGPISWTCQFCPSKFDSERELKAHTKKAHNYGKSFPCDICNENFQFKTDLDQHKKDKHSVSRDTRKEYFCDLCRTVQKDFMIKHTGMCHQKLLQGKFKRPVPKKITCSRCEKKVSREKYALHVHKEVTEQKSYLKPGYYRPFWCRKCNIVFSKTNYKYHKMAHKKKEDFFVKKIKKDRILKRKEKLLAIRKPHVCEKCGRRFTLKSSLNLHVRNEVCQRQLKCPKCKRGFKRFNAYTRHVNSCKPFVCDVCPKILSSKRKLNQHMERHQPKDFQCPNCCKHFSPINGKAHIRKFCIARVFHFYCPLCNVFDTTDVYKAIDHLSQCRAASKNDDIECYICRRMYSTEKFALHFQREALNSTLCNVECDYECTVCKLKFPNSKSLMLHRSLHPKEKEPSIPILQYICCLCDYIGPNQKETEIHFKEQHKLEVPTADKNMLTYEKTKRRYGPALIPGLTRYNCCFICGKRYICPSATSFCVHTCSLRYCIEVN